MSKARYFLSVTPAERRRLLRVFLIVAGVRVTRSLVPFPRFQALFAWLNASSRVKGTAAPSIEQLARDVRVVSSYVPRAKCLTQALAGQLLLTYYGYPTVVHVGVANEKGGGTFQAHTWLESDGKVVIS